jgi:RnfABCDGE-type electron transport complex B subunit
MAAGTVLLAVAILGGTGLLFGVLIAVANRRLYVWEDPRIDAVNDLLPGANCGACGYAGCRAFAEAAVRGVVEPAQCTVMGADMRADVAAFLGVDAGSAVRRVARLRCAGGSDVAPARARYTGITSCAAAVATGGGGKACAWGCVGHADCAVACTFGAIAMTDRDLPAVDPALCTACGDCVDACPLDLFVIVPLDQHLFVQCRNLMDGDIATAVCAVACTACGKCVQDAAPGLISIVHGLAVIDDDRVALQSRAAIERCPTGAIVWLAGAQFELPQRVECQT